ncbi:hypothetical protein JOC95_001673 [Bacillus tianshenii]|uniref:Uncharacterized protein n=2 Tax=Sutcliffiella tianshenii TaxID=1463404 RepID=A0ABS2NYV1_9BACI|nr:hypothetical protein [Bacillus tianshenii]
MESIRERESKGKNDAFGQWNPFKRGNQKARMIPSVNGIPLGEAIR